MLVAKVSAHMENERTVTGMADFTILSKPVAIRFECPFCENEVEIQWNKIEVPDSWCDDWSDIKCPYCGKMVSLGEWTYD